MAYAVGCFVQALTFLFLCRIVMGGAVSFNIKREVRCFCRLSDFATP